MVSLRSKRSASAVASAAEESGAQSQQSPSQSVAEATSKVSLASSAPHAAAAAATTQSPHSKPAAARSPRSPLSSSAPKKRKTKHAAEGSQHQLHNDNDSADATPSDRYTHLAACFKSSNALQQIHTANLLVIGAGGIGCELLKSLVLTGFRQLTLVDLDTIDVSNLNRQFLFRRQHVGQSKAHIARETVLAMMGVEQSKLCHITTHHDNIKSPQFSTQYFAQFDLVLNALDNVDARRHVNRQCLTAGVPLIESGTQGYMGQVTSIRKGETECYECVPAASTQKQFAVCTIRNTPSTAVHCIHWAKYVYSALFGERDEDNIMQDLHMSQEDVSTVANQANVASTTTASATAANGNKNSTHIVATAVATQKLSQFEHRVFARLFCDEIKKQLEAEDRWHNRKAPVPLELDHVLQQANIQWRYIAHEHDTKHLTLQHSVQWLLHTIERITSERASSIGQMVFDKDDDLAMDFVTAAANIRMTQYHIPCESRFAAKGIAGNIVHAIATTNAIAAGIAVLEAVKLLQRRYSDACTSWISRCVKRPIAAQHVDEPRPTCHVCSASLLRVSCDTSSLTLRQFYSRVLQQRLGFIDPSIDVVSANNALGTVDDLQDDNPKMLQRALADCTLLHGALLSVTESDEEATVQREPMQIEILQDDSFAPLAEDDPELEAKEAKRSQRQRDGFAIEGKIAEAKVKSAAADEQVAEVQPVDDDEMQIDDKGKSSAAPAAEEDDSDLEVVEEPHAKKHKVS